MMKAVQVFYDGRVQGVGFRYSVRQIAKGFNVTGWVRNLSDGRVELQANGEEEEVDAFLEGIRQSELASLIRKESTNALTTAPDTHGFEIRI
jgi:acylphosphatase